MKRKAIADKEYAKAEKTGYIGEITADRKRSWTNFTIQDRNRGRKYISKLDKKIMDGKLSNLSREDLKYIEYARKKFF